MALGPFNAGDKLQAIREKFNLMVAKYNELDTRSLPPMGVPGQVLTKTGVPDWEFAWENIDLGAGGGEVRVETALGLANMVIPDGISAVRTNGYHSVGDGGDALYRVGVEGLGAMRSADGRWWELADVVTVNTRMFGAKANGSNNDRAAIIAADAFCAARGLTLWFTGPHVSSDGISRTADWVGINAPQLAPFPLTGDHKNFLRPGYKHRLPGASIRFTGTGTQAIQTQRSDDFADITYCVRDAVTGLKMRGVAIVLDTDVYDAGGALTALGADNSAAYDVGHLIDDAAQTLHEDVVVWGYFPVAGTVVRSVLGNDDPDYTIFRGGSTMGKRGLALIGSETDDGFDSGLSGTQCDGLDIFSLDHHSRSPATAPAIYANADAWRCIYIDGHTDATNANLNGHYFFGGNVRTYAIHPVELDCASSVSWSQTVFETSDYAGVANAATKTFLASAETFNVSFYSCRFAGSYGLLDAGFGGTMSGQLVISSCPGSGYGGGVIVSEAKNGLAQWAKLGGASGGTGDPAIQFGQGSGSSSTAGWSVRRDISVNDVLDFVWGGASVFSVDTTGAIGRLALRGGALTIAAGVVTLGALSYYSVDTEAAAATDDLDTINGGVAGQVLILRAANSSRDVILTEVGNIRLNAGGNFTLTHAQDRITLQYDGAAWIELSRSDNTV